MKWVFQRIFLIILTSWMLIGNSGISWSQETCLYTGHQKKSLTLSQKSSQVPTPRFSRSSCYQYDHFQLKFGIDQVVQKKVSNIAELDLFDFCAELGIVQNLAFYEISGNRYVRVGFVPPSHLRRLACLGVFQI